MTSLAEHMHKLIAEKPAFWVGALLSSAVGSLLYVTTASTIERNAQVRFHNMATSVQVMVNGRIKSYTDVMRGAASLFQTSKGLTRDQFHRYVNGLSLEKEFPGIETINFARYVTEAERPAFEERMRTELATLATNYPPFAIKPPGHRNEYTVLTFIEPISAWGNRFGFDITARPEGAPALNRSRDTGEISASGAPLSILSGPNRTGLAMRLPIYRPDMPANTIEERRAAYIGSVGIGFSVQKLVQGVLDQMPMHVRMVLADVGGQSSGTGDGNSARPQVLFDSSATIDAPYPPMARPDHTTFVTTLPMGYNKRVWEAHFSVSKASLYTAFDFYVPWLALLAGSVSTMLLYILFHTLTSSRRRAMALAEEMTRELRASESKLQMSNENLRRLAAHADHIKEGERKRIAREIHDDLGQNLLALRIEADMLSARTSDRHPRLHARAQSTLQQIDATIKSVRQIINDLRPNVLDLGLNAAVDWQITQFRHRTGIRCDLVENHQDIQLSDHCATALFRILQESLSNISRHAHATRVRIELRVERGWIWMTISDNGIGLQATGHRKPGSFGLVGIEERVNILGGSFQVTSSPSPGTTIQVSVPAYGGPIAPGSPGATPSPQRAAALA